MSQDESLTVPLILDEEQTRLRYKLEDLEPNHNNTTKGTTSFKTFVNGLNALSGVGILSTPFAVASAGWLSLILLFIIAISAFYSGMLIKRCMEADSSIKSYPDIGERAFGSKGRILISILMNIELYLIATSFLILEGDNWQDLFPNVDIEFAGFHIGGRQCFVLLVALIILPTIWLDNLSILSYISATGVLATAILLGLVFWAGACDGVGFHENGELLNWNGVPIAISLFAVCYSAHPTFPTLYNSIEKKHHFSYVLLICFIVSAFSNALMATISYKMFGSEVQSQITLNLPTEKLSSKIAIYTTLVNPISKYALMILPILEAARNWFQWSYSKVRSITLVGTALLISSVIVAMAVPFFGYLIALVGASLTVTTSIILPCLWYLKITGNHRRFFRCEVVVIWGVILVGVMVFIFGTYTSLVEIVGHL